MTESPIEAPDEAAWIKFAEGRIRCFDPKCGQEFLVPILAQLVIDDTGMQQLLTMPELDELWSHMWSAHPDGNLTPTGH